MKKVLAVLVVLSMALSLTACSLSELKDEVLDFVSDILHKESEEETEEGTEADPSKAAPTESAPTEPAPTAPAPTEPAPTKPAPTEPAPTKPAPTEPAPTEPAPTEPAPTEPAPTEPAPTEPAPTEPVPTESAPTEPAPTEPVLPGYVTDPKPIGLVFAEKEGYVNLDGYGIGGLYRQVLVMLDEDSAERFPALASFLKTAAEGQASDYYSLFTDFQRQTQTDWMNDPMMFRFHEKLMTPTVRRADDNVLSILTIHREAGSGFREDVTHFGDSFDTETGKHLELTDVLSEVDSLPALLETKLTALDKSTYAGCAASVQRMIESGSLPWTLDYEGMTFYFDAYTIADGAAGAAEAFVPYAELPLTSQKYACSPDDYIVGLVFGQEGTYTANGRSYTISTWESDDNDPWTYSDISVSVNGNTLPSDFYCFHCLPYLVVSDGREYLYLQCTAENDYGFIRMYSLTDGVPLKIGTAENLNTLYVPALAAESFSGRAVLTDPSDFVLETRMDPLSTCSGCRSYFVGAAGAPVSGNPYYLIDRPFRLISKVDLRCSVVDDDMNVSGNRVVAAGSGFTVFRTDNSSFVDAMLDDGTTVRLNVQLTWPQTVEGVDAESVFDGMTFAG